MLKIVNEASFLNYIFQKDADKKYIIKGMKPGPGGNGIVLCLRTEDSSVEILKSLGEMVRDGNWTIRKHNEGQKENKKLREFLEGIYEGLKSELKRRDVKVLDLLLTKNKEKIEKFPRLVDWLKPQVLWDFTDDTAIKDIDIMTKLQVWLEEDKKTWEPIRNKEKSLPFKKVKPVGMRRGFLDNLHDAHQHAQGRVTDTGKVKFAPYLAYALNQYWTTHIQKLVKKCNYVSIESSIILEGSGTEKWKHGLLHWFRSLKNIILKGSRTEKWELHSKNHSGSAELILYFKAPEYPYHHNKGYKAEISIVAQSNETNFSLVEQLLGSEKIFSKKLNDVCYALSEYFKDNGMHVFPYGELYFKDYEDLKKWIDNLENPVPEKAIQALGRWTSRGSINCLNADKAKKVRTLLAEKLEEFVIDDRKEVKVEPIKRPERSCQKEPKKFWLKFIIGAIIIAVIATAVFFGKSYIKQVKDITVNKIQEYQINNIPNGDKGSTKENNQEINNRTQIKYHDGSYVGELSNDKRNGNGTMEYTNGDRYVGNWSDDKRYGNGTYTWVHGNKYIGGWNDGQMHGVGIVIYSNGEKYFVKCNNGEFIGQWKLKPPFIKGLSDEDLLNKVIVLDSQGNLNDAIEKED
ncbi:MAG TPA: MORN repeat-containing protein [Candidatus Brocadiia bacterium]|nr:hypothetical protein [Candidatus Brocadiales bacterium]